MSRCAPPSARGTSKRWSKLPRVSAASIASTTADSASRSEWYDEGRVSERLLIGAHMLGYGGGRAWFGDDAQQAEAKRILGIPSERTARSMVTIGRPTSSKDPRPNSRTGGRKPLSELV